MTLVARALVPAALTLLAAQASVARLGVDLGLEAHP
jgi:hypothetical protein